MSTSESFLLASLLTSYPQPEFQERAKGLLSAGGEELQASLGAQLCARIESWSSEESEDANLRVDELRSDYIDLFDRGRDLNPLYETEYGRARAMVKGNDLADIAGFYRAFGVQGADKGDGNEMLDHVAVELEFYALLLMKEKALGQLKNPEGVEVVADAQKKFLREHLGRFIGEIVERPGVLAHPVYQSIFEWASGLVNAECRRLGVSPDKAEWIAGRSVAPDAGCDMSCGGSAEGCQ